VTVALLAGAFATGWSATSGASTQTPTVTLAVVRGGVDLADLARDGMSVGIMSAGIGEVSAQKTYADISAGNRERPPSDAIPGLLDTTLREAHLTQSYQSVVVEPGDLPPLVSRLRGDDLLIAFAAPPPPKNEGLPIGIVGEGFDGNLTSDSTRADGYVLSTDLAPTILDRLGVPIPDEMDGEPVRSRAGSMREPSGIGPSG
jgi:hypothetical protein